MKDYYCAYSSDARELYKADIYKVMSMPEGSIVHFRYKLKYVDEEIIEKPSQVEGKETVIFYTLSSKSKNIPIRKSVIKKAEVLKETALFHVYMELKEFVEVKIDREKSEDKFFTKQKLEFLKSNNNWIDKVELIKDSFDGMLFYLIKSITTNNGESVAIETRKDNRASLYSLNHGKTYLINLSIGNPNAAKSKLKFESSSDDVSANTANPIEISAQYDDIIVPIYIRSLNVYKDSSFISFKPINQTDTVLSEYHLNIEIAKGIGKMRAFVFGVFTFSAILGFVLVRDGKDSITRIFNTDLSVDFPLIFGVVLLLLSASCLFYFFNKK